MQRSSGTMMSRMISMRLSTQSTRKSAREWNKKSNLTIKEIPIWKYLHRESHFKYRRLKTKIHHFQNRHCPKETLPSTISTSWWISSASEHLRADCKQRDRRNRKSNIHCIRLKGRPCHPILSYFLIERAQELQIPLQPPRNQNNKYSLSKGEKKITCYQCWNISTKANPNLHLEEWK